DKAMTIAVRLADSHHGGVARSVGEDPHVVADGVKVDERVCPRGWGGGVVRRVVHRRTACHPSLRRRCGTHPWAPAASRSGGAPGGPPQGGGGPRRTRPE